MKSLSTWLFYQGRDFEKKSTVGYARLPKSKPRIKGRGVDYLRERAGLNDNYYGHLTIGLEICDYRLVDLKIDTVRYKTEENREQF